MTARAIDDAIARLSRKQHGAWNRRQALARGASPKMIRTRVANGTWLQLDHGVYGHAAAPATWERSVMAAELAEPWAVASHRCAAVLHAVPGFRPGRPEVTVRPGANARGRLAIVHRGVDVRTTTLRGIHVVTLDQVIVDLAQIVSERRLAAALSATVDRDPRVLDAVRDRYCVLAPKGGRSWHTRVEDFERDRRRDAEAAAAGFLTLRFTWHQLVTDPRWVRRILLETAQRRLSEFGGMRGPSGRSAAPNTVAA